MRHAGACRNRGVVLDTGGVAQIGNGHVLHALLVSLAKQGHLVAQPHGVVGVGAHLHAHSNVVLFRVVRRRDLLRPGHDVNGVAPIGDPRDGRCRAVVDFHAVDHDRNAASRLCHPACAKHGGVGAGVLSTRAIILPLSLALGCGD